jgi:hypothetical protein
MTSTSSRHEPDRHECTADAVDENVAIGTVVGLTAHASDADATTNGVTYSLSSNPGNLFAIDATTGVVTTGGRDRPGGAGRQRECRGHRHSADGSSAGMAFSIAINDVNEFSVSTPTTQRRGQCSERECRHRHGSRRHRLRQRCRCNDQRVSYSLTDNAGGKFAINSSTGVITVAGAIDREVDASLDITVRATSADGSTADKVFTIAVNDVTEFAVTTPVDNELHSQRRQRELDRGTVVGVTAVSSDADATPTRSATA